MLIVITLNTSGIGIVRVPSYSWEYLGFFI